MGYVLNEESMDIVKLAKVLRKRSKAGLRGV